MSKFRNKNLLFYCRGNQESNDFLTELNKNDPLKTQFILIDQNDSKICLPPNIANTKQPLILIPNGAKEPILNREAVHWIKNSCFSEKANGLEFMNINGGGVDCSPIEGPGQVISNSKWSALSALGAENSKIDTYMEGGGNKSSGGGGNGRTFRKSETDLRFERYQKDRNELDSARRPPKNMVPDFGLGHGSRD